MADAYSEQSFLGKLKAAAIYAGREVVEKALTLYLTAQRPETPLWAKMVIYSALAYFVLPTDLIPDFVPLTGYADDLGTLATALGTVVMSITPEIKQTAKQQVNAWFGDPTVEGGGLPAQSAYRNAPDVPQAGDPIREIAID